VCPSFGGNPFVNRHRRGVDYLNDFWSLDSHIEPTEAVVVLDSVRVLAIGTSPSSWPQAGSTATTTLPPAQTAEVWLLD